MKYFTVISIIIMKQSTKFTQKSFLICSELLSNALWTQITYIKRPFPRIDSFTPSVYCSSFSNLEILLENTFSEMCLQNKIFHQLNKWQNMFTFSPQGKPSLQHMVFELVKRAQNALCDPYARIADLLPQLPHVVFCNITWVRLTC